MLSRVAVPPARLAAAAASLPGRLLPARCIADIGLRQPPRAHSIWPFAAVSAAACASGCVILSCSSVSAEDKPGAFTLYAYRPSRAQAVEWYALEKGLPFRTVSIDLADDEHKQAPYTDVNPFGKIPAIVAEDGTSVFESGAILLHLAAASGEIRSASEIGAAAKWVLYSNATFWPAASAEQKVPHDQMEVLDALLSRSTFLAGEEFTVADVAVGNYLHYSTLIIGSDCFHGFSNIQRYLQALRSRPHFKSTCGSWGQ